MGKHRKEIDFNSKRLFYTIHEVADHFAVNVSLLRFWEKEFDIINPKKTPGGVRQYSRDDIRDIQVVYRLVKQKNMTLEGARQSLRQRKDDDKRRVETLDRLKSLKSDILNIIDELQILEDNQYS